MNLYGNLLFNPLFSAICLGFFGNFLGTFGAGILCQLSGWLALWSAVALVYSCLSTDVIFYSELGTWLFAHPLIINWSFVIDGMSSIMLLVVTFISFLVITYSLSYMSEDPHLPRFLAYISLFTFFMLILVAADNFIVMFLGWEGIGLCSFLLISFWFTRISASKAAMKALLMNRISDLAFTFGIIFLFSTFYTFDFSILFALSPYLKDQTISVWGLTLSRLDMICALLFFGAVGKSAQIGLHTWLPSAMEGPTPVSALIHAATMVTAGVLLIIKCSPLFEYSPSVLLWVSAFGASTIFLGASLGLVQHDVKRVVAYSTLSQLGYMILACGISAYSASFFHLVNHAFFKALLFLASGAIIHACSNEQDMRKLGSLARLVPLTFTGVLIGTIALQGWPFLSGFYSKDAILELASIYWSPFSKYSFWLATLSVSLTIWYSTRALNLVFFEKTRGYKAVFLGVHEMNKNMAIAIIALCIPSFCSGYLLKDIFLGLGSDILSSTIFVNPKNNIFPEAEFLPWTWKYLPFFYSLIFAFSWARPSVSLYSNKAFYCLENFLINRWYFEDFYALFINSLLLLGGTHVYQILDRALFLHLFVSIPVNCLKKITNFTQYPSVVKLETKFRDIY